MQSGTMQSGTRRAGLLALAGAVSALAGPVYAPVVLSQTGGTINGISVSANYAYREANLAPGGNVVFTSQFASLGNGNYTSHLFTVIDGVTTTADPLGSGAIYSTPFINSSGQVAYSANFNGVYTGGTLVDSGDVRVLGFNDSGTVLWDKSNSGSGSLYKQSGLVAAGNDNLAAEMDGSGGFVYVTADGTNRLLSGSGTVIAGAGTSIGGTAVAGVAANFGNQIALSANGNLAVLALNPSFNAVLVTTLGFVLTPASGLRIQGFDINDSGTLVWSQYNPSRDGTSVIFTQYGRVAGAGDVIDGKTVSSVFSAGNHFLDNNGDILASVQFTNGSQELVLFEDTSAPEPASWILFAGAAGCWIGWRRSAAVRLTAEGLLPDLKTPEPVSDPL